MMKRCYHKFLRALSRYCWSSRPSSSSSSPVSVCSTLSSDTSICSTLSSDTSIRSTRSTSSSRSTRSTSSSRSTKSKKSKKSSNNLIFDIETPLDYKFSQQFPLIDEEFWGIGLENECYILSAKRLQFATKHAIETRLSRERYSVNYLENYEIESLRINLTEKLSHRETLYIPQLLNSHCFTRMDRNGQPILTYTHNPQPNPKFSGKTILEEWVQFDPTLTTMIQSDCKHASPIFFDGDSIEFVTEKFYRATTQNVIEELKELKSEFLRRFNRFCETRNILKQHLPFQYLIYHPGLAAMLTQPHRLVPFNNTTFHVHLTLPTQLEDGKVKDMSQFIRVHQRAILLLQWFQPFFISRLGSPDFLSQIFPGDFVGGSLRCAMSRYIGIGTFDPSRMQMGTIQTIPIEQARPPLHILWWRDQLVAQTKYIFPNKEIGIDIHFAKHFNCGIELRWFDGFPLELLQTVLHMLVLIVAYSQQLSYDSEKIAMRSQIWNDLVFKSIMHGDNAILTSIEQQSFLTILDLDDLTHQCTTSKNWDSFMQFTLKHMHTRLSRRDILDKLSPEFSIDNISQVRAFNLEQQEFLAHEFLFKQVNQTEEA